MPATPNKRLEDWHEPPFLGASHDVAAAPGYYPPTYAEAVQFVVESGLNKLVVYDGYPDVQREIAEEISQACYTPGCNMVQALERYVVLDECDEQVSVSPSNENSPSDKADSSPQDNTVYLMQVKDLTTGETRTEGSRITNNSKQIPA